MPLVSSVFDLLTVPPAVAPADEPMAAASAGAAHGVAAAAHDRARVGAHC